MKSNLVDTPALVNYNETNYQLFSRPPLPQWHHVSLLNYHVVLIEGVQLVAQLSVNCGGAGVCVHL